MTARGGLFVPRAVRRAIVDHAKTESPNECCGFVVGASAAVMFAVPMANVANSRVRYRIDDRAHIELRRVLRGARPSLSILGVYHSHPAGDAWPSPTDVAEAHYPDWTYLIVGFGGLRGLKGLEGRRPVLRGFRIRNGRVRQASLR